MNQSSSNPPKMENTRAHHPTSLSSDCDHAKTTSLPVHNIEYKLDSENSDDDCLRYGAFQKMTGSLERRTLTVDQWIACMMGPQSEFVAKELTKILKECPFRGFRFETKGVTEPSSSRVPFEFVLVNDEWLYDFARYADPYTFAEHLHCDNSSEDDVAVFANLGKDAMLVAPKNSKEGNGNKHRYGHLGAFLRTAPEAQILEVWKTVATVYRQELQRKSPNTVWCSTAGTGVRWLHFRFDERPKYYRYKDFQRSFGIL